MCILCLLTFIIVYDNEKQIDSVSRCTRWFNSLTIFAVMIFFNKLATKV